MIAYTEKCEMIMEENSEILNRIKSKIMEIDENIKEENLFFASYIDTEGWLHIRKAKGCMIEYHPNKVAIREPESFAVCLYDNGLIFISGEEESIIPEPLYYKNIEDFENDKPMLLKFKVKVVETYTKYVEVEAENRHAACNNIYNKINKGIICFPRDECGRELFVSEVKEDDE